MLKNVQVRLLSKDLQWSFDKLVINHRQVDWLMQKKKLLKNIKRVCAVLCWCELLSTTN